MPDQMPTRWEPDRSPPPSAYPRPGLMQALGRGFMCRCPACGETPIFRGYLKVRPECDNCGAPLGLARADDAPPYFTILLIAHIVVPSMLFVEKTYEPPLWVHAAIWLPLTLVLGLGLLRPIKGATIGLMLRLGMLKTDIDDR